MKYSQKGRQGARKNGISKSSIYELPPPLSFLDLSMNPDSHEPFLSLFYLILPADFGMYLLFYINFLGQLRENKADY